MANTASSYETAKRLRKLNIVHLASSSGDRPDYLQGLCTLIGWLASHDSPHDEHVVPRLSPVPVIPARGTDSALRPFFQNARNLVVVMCLVCLSNPRCFCHEPLAYVRVCFADCHLNGSRATRLSIVAATRIRCARSSSPLPERSTAMRTYGRVGPNLLKLGRMHRYLPRY